ncbi:uncharacterized protein LOC141533023 [Cotesia typhae]|uniref:uncharacterized protein LOC141533023 n=1 Tax=Cotesia typhae TaxID=2053667 RepID=UPI003D6909D6
MTVFMLLRDKRKQYCVHKKRHVSVDTRKDKICDKKIKIICEHNIQINSPIQLTQSYKKKSYNYFEEDCFVDSRKGKTVWFSDAISTFINSDSDQVVNGLDFNSSSLTESFNLFDNTDLPYTSYEEPYDDLSNFSENLNVLDIGQNIVIDTENVENTITKTSNHEEESFSKILEDKRRNSVDGEVQPENVISLNTVDFNNAVDNCEIEPKRIERKKIIRYRNTDCDSDSESKESESSYEPSDSEESVDEEEHLVEDITDEEDFNNENNASDNADDNNISQNTSTSTLNCSLNVSGHTGWDDDDVEAELSSKKGNAKKDRCCYCEKEYFKIARHLETVHKNELEVQSFIKLLKGSSERKDEIAVLRKRGNHMFNMKQKRKEDGTPGIIKTVRCPNKTSKQSGGNWAVCSKCKGWYAKIISAIITVIVKMARKVVEEY